jgi:membrane-associated phospholipid phosphatase
MSRWHSPRERGMIWQRRRRITIVLLTVLLLLLLLDRTFYHALYIGPDPVDLKRLEEAGWYQMFRVVGYLPTWIFIGLAMFLQGLAAAPSLRAPVSGNDGSRSVTLWAGPLIVASAALSGLIADVVKPVIGRLRPLQTDGFHRYHGVPDNILQGPAYGLPSSHAAVAFGAAFMLMFLYPRAGLVAVVAAVGCALTRTLTGAHFVTDVFVAALLAYAIARAVRPSGWSGGSQRPLLP